MDLTKLDLKQPTKILRLLNYQEKADSDEQIITNFKRDFKKTSYYVPIDLPLNISSSNPDESKKLYHVVYKANTNMSYLLYTYLRWKLPSIKVKEKYNDYVKICWSRYIAHNIVLKCRCLHGEKEYQVIPQKWFDMNFQFNIENDRKKEYREAIGDVPELIEFTNHLPEWNICFYQPFDFSRDICMALPLSIVKATEVSFEYTFDYDISRFLRVMIFEKETNTWIEKAFSYQQLIGICDGIVSRLPQPVLWGRYGKVDSEEEIQMQNCVPIHSYVISNYLVPETKNNIAIEKCETHEIIPLVSDSPVKKIYWVAENLEAKKKNIHSNYTTEVDQTIGWNPFTKVVMKYGQSNRLALERDQFSGSQIFYHCKGSPIDKGFNCISNANDKETLDADIGITYDGVDKQLIVYIDDTDPYKKPIPKEKSSDELASQDITFLLKEEKLEDIERTPTNYKIHLILETYRIIKWVRSEKGTFDFEIFDG